MELQPNSASWQVEVGGQIYEASFAELGEWIGLDSLHPEDKVRKGNLRWIEARKVPGLIPFFNAKARGEITPAVVSTTNAEAEEPLTCDLAETTDTAQVPVEVASQRIDHSTAAFLDPKYCAIHGEIASAFLCETCCNGFCKTCPTSYGGTVKICPLCGAMCKPVTVVLEQRRRDSAISNAVSDGFGASDFFNAIAHPFKFKVSLFLGAAMFAFFTIAQAGAGIGGMVMFASAIMCFMLANMVLFGVLSNTVENFSQGRLDTNFMPSFDDFSAWDDVVQPFFLYLGVMATSFGPFILTLIIGSYLVLSSASSQMYAFQSEVERLPGTQYYQGRETVEQSQQVKRVLSDITKKHDERIGGYNDAAMGNSNSVADELQYNTDELEQTAQDRRRKELEAAFGKTQQTKDSEFGEFTSSLLRLAAPLVVIGAIAFLWGLFFFPAAAAVAGYTRSFSATVNPLVGLDTIKRLGVDYVKILLMGFVLLIAWGSAGFVFSTIFSPFNLPSMGNPVAKGFLSFVTFYLMAVFACVLGYALFKNSEKLQLLK